MPMVETQASTLVRAFATDSSGGSGGNTYPSRVPTTTQPTVANNPGLIQLGTAYVTNNDILLFPFGQGDESDTFNLMLLGWKQTQVSGTTALWVPFTLCEITCTLGNTTGVADTPVGASDLFCNDISIVTGNSNVDISIIVPGGELLAFALIDVKGNNLIEIIGNLESSATAMNALISRL
jgi:hypothetical protein